MSYSVATHFYDCMREATPFLIPIEILGVCCMAN